MGTYLRERKKFAHLKTGSLTPFCSCKALSLLQEQPTEVFGHPAPLLTFRTLSNLRKNGFPEQRPAFGREVLGAGSTRWKTRPWAGNAKENCFIRHVDCVQADFIAVLLVLLHPIMFLVARTFFLPFPLPGLKVTFLRTSQYLALHLWILTSWHGGCV